MKGVNQTDSYDKSTQDADKKNCPSSFLVFVNVCPNFFSDFAQLFRRISGVLQFNSSLNLVRILFGVGIPRFVTKHVSVRFIYPSIYAKTHIGITVYSSVSYKKKPHFREA